MLDLLVLCEGQTEREFCRRVISPHVAASGLALAGTLVGKPQRKQGGIRHWTIYRQELLRLAMGRPQRHLGLLVDYYAMPNSWPGKLVSQGLPSPQRGARVEQSLREDLAEVLGGRFHPCVQLHEFESLLFVEPEIAALSLSIGAGSLSHDNLARQMATIKAECGGDVEQINDSPDTAPSKRLTKIVRGYDKVAWGVAAAADVDLQTLRAGCPWLDRWLTRITGLVLH